MIKEMGRQIRAAHRDIMHFIKHTFWLFFLLLATACSQLSTRYGTPSLPIFIAPAEQDPIPLATSLVVTLPAKPDFVQGDWVIHTQAGFAYTMPVNLNAAQPYVLQWKDYQSNISSQDEVVMISIILEDQIQADTSESCLEQVLERMIADLDDVIPGAVEMLPVGGKFGATCRVDGDMFAQDFTGRMVCISTQPGRCITALAVTLGADAEARWQAEGEPALNVMLSSLVISNVSKPGIACQVSDVAEYALSPDKPVRVGNTNLYDGYAREQLYLLGLRGPNGEKLSYYREGPVINNTGDILDVYVITYSGLTEPIKLYLDMYTYENPAAPAGFTCSNPFPLEAP